MVDFSTDMLGFIKIITAEDEQIKETHPQNPYTPFDAPQEVLDLMLFGLKAGEAAEKLDEGDATPIGEDRVTYGEISVLAAVAATRAPLWHTMEELLDRAINPIIASLDTPEQAGNWSHDEIEHSDFIASVAYGATLKTVRDTPMALVMNSLLLSLKHSGSIADQASFAMNCLKDESREFMKMSETFFRRMAFGTAISFIECSREIDEAWKANAIKALLEIDIEAEYRLTQNNKQIANVVHDLHWEEVNPKSIACFAAWLTAIYRYTKFGDTIEMLYMSAGGAGEQEDHQEDVDNDTPDGLAA